MIKQQNKVADPSRWVEDIIRDFCLNSPDNSLKNKENDRAFDSPIVGFSSGVDPLYLKLKKDIGPFYMTPLEIFERSFPSVPVRADELTVISFILPLTKRTREDNRKETFHPSERWARAKHYGEEFSAKLCTHVIGTLERAGYEAAAPAHTPLWSIATSERYGRASTWSQRHTAYVSGLGTFGLCDGLITDQGKAVRCDSIIARISISPTPRPYTDHHAYCLFYAYGTCGRCIERCPAGAITTYGHDKVRCRAHVNDITQPYVKDHFDIDDYGCGLCQTGVPCEAHNPIQSPNE
ncbi:MAG TPA: hypothetical protein VK436_11940 [Methanocella sp.]|nr:hypothetical protein [Methanocella sp.]